MTTFISLALMIMRYEMTAFISLIFRFVRMSSQDQVIRYHIRVLENVVTRSSHSISCSCSWECRHKIKSFSIMFVFVLVFIFREMTHVSFLISFSFWRCSCSSRARASLMRMFRYQSLLTFQSSHRDRQWDEMKMSDVRKRNRMIVK
jgi:hypothetical protein